MPGIQLPIVDQLVHPSLGILTRVALPSNPYVGPFVAIAPPQNIITALTYGVCLKIDQVAPAHGRSVSFPIKFWPPLGQMASNYTDASGLSIIKQIETWTFSDQCYLWEEPLPALWSIYLAPDVSVNLYWLQT